MSVNSRSKAPRKLDPRSPFVADVRELGRRPGAMSELERELPADKLITGKASLDGLYTAESADLELRVRLESVVEGVLATGEWPGRWSPSASAAWTRSRSRSRPSSRSCTLGHR